jgi:hypothetical protein
LASAPPFSRCSRAGQSTVARPASIAAAGIARPPRRMAAIASPALPNWCRPGRRGLGRSSSPSSSWKTSRPRSEKATQSRLPAKTGAASRAAFASITSITSATCGATTAGRRRLMMPAFSPAISRSVLPRNFSWSNEIGAIAATSGSSTILVAS